MKRESLILTAGVGAFALAVLFCQLLSSQAPLQTAASTLSPAPSPLLPSLLQRLARECDPLNPDADYSLSTWAMPTEKKRDALIAEFRRLGPSVLPEVKAERLRTDNPELKSMLLIVAAALGDPDSVVPTGQTLVWSDFPAVRLSAARVLRQLRDPRSVEWLQSAARSDERFVHNSDCAKMVENYYPVRTVAELALNEMGVPDPVEQEARVRESILRKVLEREPSLRR